MASNRKLVRAATQDNFVTEKIDVITNNLLGTYDDNGEYSIAPQIISELIGLKKIKKTSFANSVFERYLNPFVRHELMSIALNSISKYKARVLPTVKDYYEINGKLPTHAMFSLASLIKFYFGLRGNEEIKLKC